MQISKNKCKISGNISEKNGNILVVRFIHSYLITLLIKKFYEYALDSDKWKTQPRVSKLTINTVILNLYKVYHIKFINRLNK